MATTLIKKGICECKMEPRGDHGLEGYIIRETYSFFHYKTDKGEKLYQIMITPDYGEICSISIFPKYFKEIQEK